MEPKKVEFKFEDKHLIIKVDLNKDGESLMEFKLNLAEIPDEVLSALKSKKAGE
jgi:hypothetical protein